MIQPIDKNSFRYTRRARRSAGFTLVELMLSMAFVSVLLVTIAVSVMQMATIYNRGITLKEVNQAARDVSDDLRRSVQASSVFTVNSDESDSANLVQLKSGSVVATGRLCLGKSSYLWNTAKAIETGFSDRIRYTTSAGSAGDDVNLVKVPDATKKYCAKDSSSALVNKNITYADSVNATELLKQGDRTLRLLYFAVTTTDSAYDPLSAQRLYTVSYTIGTGNTSAMSLTSGVPTACLPPSDLNSDLTYCNVQQFSVALRAGNAVN